MLTAIYSLPYFLTENLSANSFFPYLPWMETPLYPICRVGMSIALLHNLKPMRGDKCLFLRKDNDEHLIAQAFQL